MGKKKQSKSVWTDRRTWLMNTVSALLILVLGKGWEWLQTRVLTPAPTARALSIGLDGSVYSVGTPSDSVSLALSEARSITIIPEAEGTT